MTERRHILSAELEAELELRWRLRAKAHHVLADLDHQDVDWTAIADVLRSAVDAIETWAEDSA